jgi:hypothetical protein
LQRFLPHPSPTSADGTVKIKIWDAAAGVSSQTLENYSDYVNSSNFITS